MVVFAWACSEKTAPMSVKKVHIGNVACELSALIYIAEAQKFFSANNLDVTIRDYSTCREAVDSMLKGEVNLATCSEFDIVDKTFQNENIQAIATIARYQNEFIVSRLEKGIKNTTDLRGKRVGLPRRSVAEYYLGRFIDLHGLSVQDVTLVDIDPDYLLSALSGGYVDAVVIWQPYITKMENQLMKGLVIWPIQSEQTMSWNLIGSGSELQRHPELIERVLCSLDQAEKYLKSHPSEARACVQNRLGYNDSYMTKVWRQNQFCLTLDQSLIQVMEDEARWMIENNLTVEKTSPDFLQSLSPTTLETVKPESITLEN